RLGIEVEVRLPAEAEACVLAVLPPAEVRSLDEAAVGLLVGKVEEAVGRAAPGLAGAGERQGETWSHRGPALPRRQLETDLDGGLPVPPLPKLAKETVLAGQHHVPEPGEGRRPHPALPYRALDPGDRQGEAPVRGRGVAQLGGHDRLVESLAAPSLVP